MEHGLMHPLPDECYVGKKAAVFHLKGDGGYINWAMSGKFNRHDKDVSFEDA